jgi:type II secretory pathway pseudopilin PulG
MSYPLFRSTAGLSRIELLVLTGVFVILAGVGYWSVGGYLKRVGTTRGVESARTINTLISQYATDNNDVYPVGEGTPAAGKSEGIALNLLQNNFTPDASVFAVGSTVAYSGKAADYADIAPANISWDFTGGATPVTGLSTSAPDLLPTVYGTGETVAYPTLAGAGLDLPLSGHGPFGSKGIVVAYKGGNTVFIMGTPAGNTNVCPGFISEEFRDPGPYSQIKP